jgi:hypothetical protein
LKAWKIVVIPTLVTLTIGAVYLLFVWKQRQNPGVIGQPDAGQTLSNDDLAVVRTISPQHFEDTLRLEGSTVWMKNGYTIAYFPYENGRVQFTKRVGFIPSAQRLEIKKIVKSAAPASVDDGLSHGSRQAFAVFAMPGSANLYAAAIGVIDGSEEAYYPDLLFFYDDPHTVYDHWPKDVWAAIDARQVKPGMSELETRMAIGQNIHADSRDKGNRTVTYDQNGKHWVVTYVDDKATAIKSE